MRCGRRSIWNERGVLLGTGGMPCVAIAGLCVLVAGLGGTAHADERPREPHRRGAMEWSHTNQDNLVPPSPNLVFSHTNQDREEPGGDGDEEEKRSGFPLPSDPDRPLHLHLLNVSSEPYSVLPLQLVPGAPMRAPLNEPISSAMSGVGAAGSGPLLNTIPGPGALAPLVIAALLGGRGRHRRGRCWRNDS